MGFVFSWFYCPQNKPEAGVDGNYSSRTPGDYLDLSGSCVVHSRTITFIITSCGLETKGGKNEKGITSSKRYCDSVMFTFSVVLKNWNERDVTRRDAAAAAAQTEVQEKQNIAKIHARHARQPAGWSSVLGRSHQRQASLFLAIIGF